MKTNRPGLKLPNYNYTLKPTVIPKDFTVVIDTREQKPLFTNHPNLPIVHKKLDDGDYSLLGYEDKITIERKMDGDYRSYVGKEAKKTQAKLKRMMDYEYAALVVEQNWEDLHRYNEYSRLHPESSRGFLASVDVKYGITVFCNRNREWCERFVLDRMVKWFNYKNSGK